MSDYVGKRSERKVLYLLLAIIAVLLVAAIAVIVYLVSRMSSPQQTPPPVSLSAMQPTRSPVPAAPTPPKAESHRSPRLATEEIATIVQMVMTQMQNTQKATATSQPASQPNPSALPTTPGASAPQTASDNLDSVLGALDGSNGTPRPAVRSETPVPPAEPDASVPPASSDDLESVLSALENVDADTVEERPERLPTDATVGNTHAKKDPKRANDNFNKVVVSDNSADDLSQLGIEIDQLENDQSTPESSYEKTMEREVAERKNEMRTIVVKEGDTLMSIAKKAYGDALKYTRILEANPGIIKNPDRIFVGQVLRVPK